MYARIVTPPAVEPVSLTEAKLHLRLAVSEGDAPDYDQEDSKLSGLITAAREYVENHTRRALITQTWDVAFDCFPGGIDIALPFAPLQSVTSISYTGTDGNAATFAEFSADIFGNGARLQYGYSWPAIQPGSRVTVRFVTGYGAESTAVPSGIKQAMLLIIGHLHENPEEVVVLERGSVERLPMGVDSLLSGYRRYEF